MNYKIIFKILGKILFLLSLMMIPSALVSLIYKENRSLVAFLISILLLLIISSILKRINSDFDTIKMKEGFAIVSLGWIAASLFGAIPYLLSGSIPSVIDAFFETVSGFTTTGASIIVDIEVLPKGIVFWRSFTHWIGGMGILVFAVVFLPKIGAGGFQIFKAESPGPISEKIAPKIKDTAKILYSTFLVITLVEVFLLLIGGMNLYDALIHSFGTVGTGGSSTKNASIGAFNSNYIYMVISLFMIISGINFSLLYSLFKGKVKETLQDNELRFYLSMVGISIILIAINIRSLFTSVGDSLIHSIFQVSSIVTTTGYFTTDFNQWPTFSKLILFLLMFVGGCSGSTSGAIKQIRILLIFQLVRREFKKIFHPHAMIPLKVDGQAIPSDLVANVTSFFIIYLGLFVAGTLFISLESIDMITSASSVAATLGNIGIGFELVGVNRNFGFFSSASKLAFSFLMLAGRLELFTLLSLFTPSFWKIKQS